MMAPFINGKKASPILLKTCIIPKAVPSIFFLTTSGIVGKTQLLKTPKPNPRKTKPTIDPVKTLPLESHC